MTQQLIVVFDVTLNYRSGQLTDPCSDKHWVKRDWILKFAIIALVYYFVASIQSSIYIHF